jgi:hypothetical protein
MIPVLCPYPPAIRQYLLLTPIPTPPAPACSLPPCSPSGLPKWEEANYSTIDNEKVLRIQTLLIRIRILHFDTDTDPDFHI